MPKYKTIQLRQKYEVNASSKQQAITAIRKKYGFWADDVELVEECFATSKKHLNDASINGLKEI